MTTKFKMRSKKTPKEISSVLDFQFVEMVPIPPSAARSWFWLFVGCCFLGIPLGIITFLCWEIFS